MTILRRLCLFHLLTFTLLDFPSRQWNQRIGNGPARPSNSMFTPPCTVVSITTANTPLFPQQLWLKSLRLHLLISKCCLLQIPLPSLHPELRAMYLKTSRDYLTKIIMTFLRLEYTVLILRDFWNFDWIFQDPFGAWRGCLVPSQPYRSWIIWMDFS